MCQVLFSSLYMNKPTYSLKQSHEVESQEASIPGALKESVPRLNVYNSR